MRSADYQNPPMVVFCTQIIDGWDTIVIGNDDGKITRKEVPGTQIIFHSAPIHPKKQGLFIKDRDKNTFHNSTLGNRISAGLGIEEEINGVTCYAFTTIALSHSYVQYQISRKTAIKLNGPISEIWKAHYMKFKFVSQNKGETKIIFAQNYRVTPSEGDYGLVVETTYFKPNKDYPNVKS